MWSKLLTDFPAVVEFRHQAASTYFLLGLQYEEGNRLAEARQALRQSVTLARDLVAAAPDMALYQQDLSQGLYHLGRLLLAAGEIEKAEALWRQQRALLEKVLHEQPKQNWPHAALSFVLGNLGDLDRQRGVRWWTAPPWPPAPTPLPLGAALHNLAGLSAGQAYLTRAADEYRQGLREQRQALKLGQPQPMHYVILSRHAKFLGELAAHFSDYEDMADAAAGAAQAAQGLAAEPDGGQRYRLAAGFMARCATLIDRAANLSAPEKATRARQHVEQVVELLAKAVKAGFRNVDDLEQSPDFAAIRSRPDFQKLLGELKKSR